VNPERPGSLETLRRHNRVRVLEVLRRRGAASRAAIGRETGLSRTSVSSLVADLIAEGVVVESPDSEPRSSSPNGGRPSTPLTLDPSAGGVIGMDFGHDSVRVILTDLSYTVLDETLHQLDVDNEARKALAHAAGAARTLLDEHQIDRDRVVAGAGRGSLSHARQFVAKLRNGVAATSTTTTRPRARPTTTSRPRAVTSITP